MRVEQAWHGYDAGHGLRAASVSLLKEERKLLDELTDLAGYLDPGQAFDHYDMGYPCGRFYVFSRTWPDLENSRPGTVQTHSLLCNADDVADIEDPRAISHAFFSRPLATRSDLATAMEVWPSPPLDVFLPNFEATRVLEEWFASNARPILVQDMPNEVVAWLWRRLPRWQRKHVAYCSFTVRPRQLRERSFDILGVAPGSIHAFRDLSLGNGRQEEHPELQALLEQASAQGIWRAAELEGVGEVDARLWLRFRRLDEAAASSPAAALGALDLLPALLGNPSAGPALRSRTVERLVGPLETAEAEPSTAQALANLAVRDLDRVVLGANARVDALIARQLRSRLRIADSEELPALAALINAAIRGGREQQVDGSLREGLAVTTGAPGWELAWSIRPQAAWAAWNLLPNRRREEVGPVFAQLSPSTISGVFPYILEDDELWSWVSERLEVQSYIEREIDRIVVSGGDWPADRRLRLATPRIVQKFLIGPSPPPRLAASISLSLAEQPAYLPSEPSQVPEWLVGLWAREADGRTLRDLLEAHPRLLRYLVLALAQHRLENDAERWGTLLFAAPDAALLTLDGPEALPPWSDVQLRWARRVAPLSVAALPSRALTLETCAAWVGVLPDDPKTIDAIDNAAAADFPIVLALLRHPSAPWLQRRPEIVMQVLAKWWRQDSPRRAPDARTIESFLLELRNAAPQVYEGAASAMLAGILENPEPALGGLAALTFPILHQRLCQGRNERWLVRLLERWWGGHWDRAGRLRERYARAWQEAGWSVTNLWAAADHDEQTFEQLVREVLELGEGSRRLRLAFEELPKRAQRIVKNEM